MYYGATDGGQDVTKWRRNVTIGEFEATDFSQTIKGLQIGTRITILSQSPIVVVSLFGQKLKV